MVAVAAEEGGSAGVIIGAVVAAVVVLVLVGAFYSCAQAKAKAEAEAKAKAEAEAETKEEPVEVDAALAAAANVTVAIAMDYDDEVEKMIAAAQKMGRGNDLTGAIGKLEQALDAMEEEDEREESVLQLLGDFHLRNGDGNLAIKTWMRSLARSEELSGDDYGGDPKHHMACLYKICAQWTRLGNPMEGLQVRTGGDWVCCRVNRVT